MKVQELIAELQKLPGDAAVMIAQPSLEYNYAVYGVQLGIACAEDDLLAEDQTIPVPRVITVLLCTDEERFFYSNDDTEMTELEEYYR